MLDDTSSVAPKWRLSQNCIVLRVANDRGWTSTSCIDDSSTIHDTNLRDVQKFSTWLGPPGRIALNKLHIAKTQILITQVTSHTSLCPIGSIAIKSDWHPYFGLSHQGRGSNRSSLQRLEHWAKRWQLDWPEFWVLWVLCHCSCQIWCSFRTWWKSAWMYSRVLKSFENFVSSTKFNVCRINTIGHASHQASKPFHSEWNQCSSQSGPQPVQDCLLCSPRQASAASCAQIAPFKVLKYVGGNYAPQLHPDSYHAPSDILSGWSFASWVLYWYIDYGWLWHTMTTE